MSQSDELFDAYQVLMDKVRWGHITEDDAHDVYLKLLQRQRAGKLEKCKKTYVLTKARYKKIDRHRTEKKEEQLCDDEPQRSCDTDNPESCSEVLKKLLGHHYNDLVSIGPTPPAARQAKSRLERRLIREFRFFGTRLDSTITASELMCIARFRDDDATLLAEAGRMFAFEGQPMIALPIFKESLERGISRKADVELLIAKTLGENGRRDEALDRLAVLRQAGSPVRFLAQYELAVLLKKVGHLDRAWSLLSKLPRSLEPEVLVAADYHKASILIKRNRLTDAGKLLERCEGSLRTGKVAQKVAHRQAYIFNGLATLHLERFVKEKAPSLCKRVRKYVKKAHGVCVKYGFRAYSGNLLRIDCFIS